MEPSLEAQFSVARYMFSFVDIIENSTPPPPPPYYENNECYNALFVSHVDYNGNKGVTQL